MAAEKIKVFKQILIQIKGCTKESLEKYSPGKRKNSEPVTIDLGGNITKWSLSVNPNGDADVNKSNIGFFLDFDDFDSSNFSVKYELGLVGKTEKGNYMRQSIEKSGDEIKELKGESYGIPKFISHEKLFIERSDLIVDGSLTFFCDLTLSTMDVKKVSPEHAHGVDMTKVFIEGLFTDFEFKTSDGETLKAHKAILAARSPVFLAMFTTDMKEVRENFVNITDFDFVVMQEVLRYIYCNEVQDLDEIVYKLIYAADKYQLDGLKDICVDRIISLVSTENVVESLVIADRFSDTKLFDECIDLMATYGTFEEISNTNEWKDILPTLATKIISKLIKRNEKIQMKPLNL